MEHITIYCATCQHPYDFEAYDGGFPTLIDGQWTLGIVRMPVGDTRCTCRGGFVTTP